MKISATPCFYLLKSARFFSILSIILLQFWDLKAQTSSTIWLTPTDTYFLGQGFRSYDKVGMGNAINQSDFVTRNIYQSSSTTNLTYSYDYTSSSNFKQFGASVNFSADLVSVYANYNQSSYQSTNYQSDQLTLLVTNIDTVKTILNITNPQNYNNNISSQSNFINSYGDNIVSTIGYGRKLIATLTLSRSSSSDFQSMQAGFGGSYNGFFVSGSASAYFNSSLSNVHSSADFNLYLQTIGPHNDTALSSLNSKLVNDIVNICTDNTISDKMRQITTLFSNVDLNSTQGRSALYIQTSPYSNYGINIESNPFNLISQSNIQSMIDCYHDLELCKSQLNQLNSYLNVNQDTINKYYSLVVGQENSLVQKYEEYKANPSNVVFDPTQFFPSSKLSYFLNKWIKKYVQSFSTSVQGLSLASATCCDYQVTNFKFGSALGNLKNLNLGVDFSIHPNGQISWLVPYCYPMVVDPNVLGTPIVNCPKYDFSTNGFINYAVGESLTISGIELTQNGSVDFEIWMDGVQATPWGSNISLGSTNLKWDYNFDTTITPTPLIVPHVSFAPTTIVGINNLNALDQITTNSEGAIYLTSSNNNILSVSGMYLVPLNNGIVTVTLNLSNTSTYTATTVSATFTVSGAGPKTPNNMIAEGYLNSKNPVDLNNYFETDSDGNVTFKIFGSSIASISGNNLYPIENGVITVLALTSSTRNYAASSTPITFNIALGTTDPINSFLGTTLVSKDTINLMNYFATDSNGKVVFSTQSSCAGLNGNLLVPVCNGAIKVTATTAPTTTYNGSEISAEFSISGLTEFEESTLNLSSPRIYPNPTSGKLTINNTKPHVINFKLFDPKGSLNVEGDITPGLNDLDLSSLENGIYYLNCNETVHKVILIK